MISQEDLWRRYDAIEARLTAPVSERMLDLAELQRGMQVLDLATGRGEPALRAARRVAPSGRVLGVDVAEGLLEMAQGRADHEGITNLALQTADAERMQDLPPAGFQAATCRWGLMYMPDPVAALAHVRRALTKSGVFVAALWAEPERVPYHTLPRDLLKRQLSELERLPDIDFEAPGIFRFASLARIERDFERAGLSIDHVEEMDIPVFESETPAEVVTWTWELGLSKLAEEVSESTKAAWEKAFAAELEARRGGPMLQPRGITRIVRARA